MKLVKVVELVVFVNWSVVVGLAEREAEHARLLSMGSNGCFRH